MDAYYKLSRQEIEKIRAKQPLTFTGIEQSDEMMKFLWENFSAAGGDHPSLEAWPTQKDYALHEVLLAGWGFPIGELFDLEKLGEHCKKVGRWSFFMVSKPTNVSCLTICVFMFSMTMMSADVVNRYPVVLLRRRMQWLYFDRFILTQRLSFFYFYVRLL
jgi:hypothetical protein